MLRILKYISSIGLILFLFSPYVLADEYTHTLGGKVVPSIEENEVTQFITNEINIWKTSAVEQLNSTSPHLQVTPEDFEFNIEQSVEQFVDKADVPWYAFWKRDQEVHQPLIVNLSERLISAVDNDPSLDMVQTQNDLELKASVLSSEPIQLVAGTISVADMERVGYITKQTGLPAAEINAVVELLNEKVLQPQEEFSLLELLKQGASPITEETSNFVASMLYTTVLQTEFAIIERHSQGMVPSYGSLGLEAMVNEKLARDFKFKNTFDTPVTIQSSNLGGQFTLEMYTLDPDSTASYEVGSREEIKPKRIERLVADLAYGRERQVETGKSGWRVVTYRTITSTTGSFETQEVVAHDYYPPVHNVFEISSQPKPPEVSPGTGGTGIGGTGTGGTGTGGTGTVGTGTGGTGTGGSGTGSTGNGTGGSGDNNDDDNGSGGNDDNNDDSDNQYDKGGNKID